MKRTIVVFSLFAGQMMFMSAFASAQTGTYTESCTNIRTVGRDLVADCKNVRGGTVTTTLPDFLSCREGSIDNIDGRLSCERR